ncbi:MAG: outer membrane protein assembly factor BamD [Gammaproteobacteria bacterium]|nr:outer membrane protein assembly factor BamD [Gammaproteobacteria bacterium]
MKTHSSNFTAFALRLPVLLLCLNLLTGCALLSLFEGDEDQEESAEVSADQDAAELYGQANRSLERHDFTTAIERYELLESRYPFGRFAQQSQLELSYAYYKQDEYEKAISTIDRFIKLNPRHPSIPYAFYIKGLATFDSGRNFVHFILGRDPSNNDPTSLYEAFEIFDFLIKEYPNSKYIEDAKWRMVYLRNELAEYELKVADFYMRRGAYVAAANRVRYVLDKFQGADVMPQALYLQEQAYTALGLDGLASDTQRVFEQNFEATADGQIPVRYALQKQSCAQGIWQRMLETVRLKTYDCD